MWFQRDRFDAEMCLHGTLTQIVARRTSELGLRRAVGAQSWDLLWLVRRQGGIPLVAGLVTGVAAAPVVARILGKFWPGDPPYWIGFDLDVASEARAGRPRHKAGREACVRQAGRPALLFS